MDVEELFTTIKTRADLLRLEALGTGTVQQFTLYKNGIPYRFSIGLRQLIGFEVYSVGDESSSQFTMFIADRLLRPSDVITDSNYDEVNILVSGMLAAIYGKSIDLKQLIGNYYP